MIQCCICKGKAGILSASCHDGKICKGCSSLIPTALRGKTKNLAAGNIRKIVEWEKDNIRRLRKEFICTNSYGRLHIDEINGFFAITDKKNIKGNKLVWEITDIFEIIHLKDFALTANTSDPKQNSVCMHVNLTVQLEQPACSFTVPIRDVYCVADQVDDNTISYHEPAQLAVFRSLFFQIWGQSVDRYNRSIQKDFLTPTDVEKFKARALFMLDDEYTLKQLKKQRNRLIHAFHPDGQEEDDVLEMTEYTRKINDAYKILKSGVVPGF